MLSIIEFAKFSVYSSSKQYNFPLNPYQTTLEVEDCED